jgi:erythromycin esterase-like protein
VGFFWALFVPLGEEGWTVHDTELDLLPRLIADAAEPLPDIDDPAFGQMFDRFADARVVLLGEASHGTSEFYRARAAISKRLIERHGFNIVAVEADWPDAATVDRYVRHRPSTHQNGTLMGTQRKGREGELRPFERFPAWMWRNTDVDAFIRWLRGHNHGCADEAMCGFYGLDLYNLSGSMQAVTDFLDEQDPELARLAHRRYCCLEPWADNPQLYGHFSLLEGYARCEVGVVQMLKDLLQCHVDCFAAECDEWLDAAANARLVKDAEAYYRMMYRGSAESWNLRDTHMFETLNMILDARGPNSKAIVWAHNSHIGNAAFTDMGIHREELNVGQLAKGKFGEKARLIGFGTHRGTVAAADDWDEPMQVKQVNPSLPESHERKSHEADIASFLLDLREGELGARLRAELMEPRLERFIGVIYRPETERWSHYSEAILPRQFDAWLWFDETSAITPLPGEQRPGDEHVLEDETYPFGL